MASRFPPFVFVELVSPYNKKNITRWFEDMNFMFSWQEQYLTRSLRSLVRYSSCHENIKFISSRHCVISSIYIFCRMFRTSDNFLDPRQFTRDPRQFTRNTRHAPIRLSRFRPDFGRRDRAEILAARIFASRRESWRDSRQDPGKILAAGIFASRRESWRVSRQDPGEILAAGNFASWRESCRDPSEIPAGKKNPGGIPAEIAAGSRQDPGPYFTRAEAWHLNIRWCSAKETNAKETC